MMKVYTCDDHDGYWPVPTASVIVARDEDHARELLDALLAAKGLKTSKDHQYTTLVEIDLSVYGAYMLSDGDY